MFAMRSTLRLSRTHLFTPSFRYCNFFALPNHCPTYAYFPPPKPLPRFSLKQYNMQLSQSIVGKSPNLERTLVVWECMKYDGVKPNHVTFYFFFRALHVHELYDNVNFIIFFFLFSFFVNLDFFWNMKVVDYWEEMKKYNIKCNYEIYEMLLTIYKHSKHQKVKEIIKDIEDNGAPEREEEHFTSDIFPPTKPGERV